MRENQLRHIADSIVTLTQLRALATVRGDWKATWHTPPAGQLRAAFYRDTAYLGVLSIGPDFIGAQNDAGQRFRSIAPWERVVVAKLLAQ